VAHETPSRPARTFRRGSEEFNRVLAFSDGVFAIAMTLLVVAIGVPGLGAEGSDEGALLDALDDLVPEIVSFCISFAVIGRYWLAHHQTFARLAAMDYGLVGLNLVYLAFIAFLPFPTALLGSYFENPVSVALYALMVGAVSGLEVVVFRHAHRRALFERAMPEHVFRWGVLASTLPVAFFWVAIPLAFVNTILAVAMWFAVVPVEVALDRRAPREVAEWL
jgi:uncharacterized membrane protein